MAAISQRLSPRFTTHRLVISADWSEISLIWLSKSRYSFKVTFSVARTGTPSGRKSVNRLLTRSMIMVLLTERDSLP